MGQVTINFVFEVNGAPADATTVVLRDPTGTYGVKRLDNGFAVVAAGTAMERVALGRYRHVFTEPAAGLRYNYWVRAEYQGIPYEHEEEIAGAAAVASISYLTVSDADALAALVPVLAGWSAADAARKALALELATADVDNAMPYQGRRYDTAQPLQFPRVAYEDRPLASGVRVAGPMSAADVIWDWDEATKAAVVPRDVKLATLYQADSILAGKRAGKLAAQHDGVAYEQAGAMGRSYKQDRSLTGQGVVTGLERQAYRLMLKYRLKAGQLL